MNESPTPDDPDETDEPGLTMRNSQTIRGEETLADDENPSAIETSTRTADHVIPTSYGAAGGMTPDTDEN